jgi:superfamily II DNA or RNA helicase
MIHLMKLTFSRKTVLNWAGAQIVRDAETLIENGLLLEADFEEPFIKGAVLHNNRRFETCLEILPDGSAENHCRCYANKERGLICHHVVALALSIVKRRTDPMREAKYREEKRRASRLAEIDENEYLHRVPEGSEGGLPAKLRVTLADGWQEQCMNGSVSVSCDAVFRRKKHPIDDIPGDTILALSKEDESLLFVLEDVCEGPAKGTLELAPADFMNVLRLRAGKKLYSSDGAVTVNKTPLSTIIKMDLDRETGELILIAHTELPFMEAGEFPFYIVSGNVGWAYGAQNFWPLETVLPGPYHSIYSEPVIISRSDVLRFLQNEFPKLARVVTVQSDISLDLFTIDPARPSFRLLIKGSPASLSATLFARYEGIELVAVKPNTSGAFAIPDPKDLLRYTTRNFRAEQDALELLVTGGASDDISVAGLRGECGDGLKPVIGKREVLNFLGTHLPRLRRLGWRVELDGRISGHMDAMDFATPVVHVRDSGDGSWFDVGFDFEDQDQASISSSDIQLALRKGESFIVTGGKTILVDSDAISSMQDVFSDCAHQSADEAGYFRLPSIYSSFVKSSLDAMDGIDIEDSSSWRSRAAEFDRDTDIKPVKLAGDLDSILRSYQKTGVNWLRLLEERGFCGLLADEMGLGKTVETLAWLSMDRVNSASTKLPTLIVCPTSLVENWVEETDRFVPDQKAIILTGSDRDAAWEQIDDCNIAVTSYAILRRDLDRYTDREFAVVVLDEAQHIKNRSTQNAVAAKMLKAHHKLVLTGTPIENSVSDLWSIMDFLMPGYLGSHENFRQCYELPIDRGTETATAAKVKLRRKLHPFMLRRLKIDVASDLPDKIEKVATCTLSPDQRAVYNELLKKSTSKIQAMVAKTGFNKCRMDILVILMKLRQICCHLDLLKLDGLAPKRPSAKLELFLELIDEAVDSGHRILVFSQFVSMLHILRDELEKRDLKYCYLDGSTKNRQSIVREFNTERSIPLFLISLKAGGTGLNLTGADMVVHFDPWWNPAVENQATDRAHRIGQKRTVYSIKLITKGTVEEKVLEMQRRKQSIIDATIESDEKVMTALSWEDVQDLLKP